MRIREALSVLMAVLLAVVVAARATGQDTDRQSLARGLDDLNGRIQRLRTAGTTGRDQLADAEVYAKGVAWALRHETSLTPDDVSRLDRALQRGRDRVTAMEGGKRPWIETGGRVVRGFVSAIDGSVQPYGLVTPVHHDRKKPSRLDVVLHGSSKPSGMSEVRFMARFDERVEGDDVLGRDYLELHPLGRVENGYRWAGETDVFEAIEAVCRDYDVDRDRIVLRGMSMGASGTWHLGLKHPDRFVALGPYCGYVDTHRFSETPLPSFVKVGLLPPDQEKTLHMLDSVDYAANAGVVPAIACIGEKDIFFQAHEIMGRAMEQEGLMMVNLISPGTGHVIDPVTHAEQMRRLGAIAAKGLDHAPRHIRFVTWTLKYSRCHWLQVLGLGEHYARAELEASVTTEGMVEVSEPRNVTRFAILPPLSRAENLRVRVGGKAVPVPAGRGAATSRGIVIAREDGKWVCLGELDPQRLDGKRPGLQGPIDDAFTAPFLCVRGTGKAWNPAVQAWAEASLERFAREWDRYFRGKLPLKDDTDVTPEDVRRNNLILFGDPGSNSWIARVLPSLPIRWTRAECAIGETVVPAAGHAPVLIHPNPLAPDRYVVLNSGHTFHEQELSTLNYLLFPRRGDWAAVRIGDQHPARPEQPSEQVVSAGFFDEHWGVPGRDGGPASIREPLPSPFQPPAALEGKLGNYRSPLLFRDGSPVRNADDWERRRREILQTWHDMMGPWPPSVVRPRVVDLEVERLDGLTRRHVRLEIAPGVTTDDAYLLEPSGDGPFPAVLVVFYDSKTGAGLGGKPGPLDFALQLARRGFVALSLGLDPVASYPDREHPQLQPLSFHAYVSSSAHNALAGMTRVDARRIGVLGHSYGGKWAMFASCLFDKFACGVWSDPGIVFDESRSNVNYWEPWYLGWEPGRVRKPGIPNVANPRTGAYRRLIEAGHDLHELHALMAPRPFLVSGGSEDPPERWKALNHTIAVNRLIGQGGRVAMTNRPGHTPTAESNAQIFQFLEEVLKTR